MPYVEWCEALLELLRGQPISFAALDDYYKRGFTPQEAALCYRQRKRRATPRHPSKERISA
jgi:hypothetical protein